MSDDPTRDELLARVATLEAKLARLRQVLDLLPDYVYVIDGEGRYRMTNRATAEAVGHTPESVLEVRFQDVTADPAQGARLMTVAEETMARGEPKVTPDVPFRLADGTDIVIELHEVPFIDEATGGPMLLGIARDRTADAHLEDARLERARLERELDLARRIQQSLLPSAPPRHDGFRFAGFSAPAASAGGDFYDWFGTPDGTTYAVIGDVTGHGIGPALIAATTRAYGRSIFRSGATLPELLGRLNAAAAAELPPGYFVTLAAVAIRPGDAPVEIIAAGHGPTFQRAGSTGDAVEVETHGPPLGVVPDYDFTAPETVDLAPGGRVVLISDGFFERRDAAGRFFGAPALAKIIAAHREGPQTLIDALRGAVDRFAGAAPQDDDMTTVVIERDAGA